MKVVTKVVSFLWIANFIVYIVVASWLGGDALNGHVDGGRYYLAMQGHSTEVSRAVFEYSRWHTYVLLVHFAAAVILALCFLQRDERVDRTA